MANIQTIIKEVLLNEGVKLTNIDGDSGKRTYAGISERWNPDCPIWKEIDKLGLKNGEYSAHLDQFVIAFYEKSEYIVKTKAEEIVSKEVARKLVDDAVNIGTLPAIKLWQETIGAPITGKMDDHTLNLTNQLNPY